MLTTRQAEELWGRDHLRLLVERGIYKRVLRGVYAEADDDDPWLTHRAALLIAPSGSGLCGPSSAALLTTMVDIPSRPHLSPLGS